MRRRWLKDALLVVGIVFLAVAALESIAWRLEPKAEPPRTLELEPPPPKPRAAFRIFAFGSSCVYGMPVPELGFISQLEFWLRQSVPHLQIEIHNFAVPGRSSAAVLETVRQAIGWEPDLVLIHTGAGEFLRRDPVTQPAPTLVGRMLSRSALLRAARRTARQIRRNRAGEDTWASIRFHRWNRDSAEFRHKIERYESNLSTMVETVRASGTPLLLATVMSNLADWPPVTRFLSSPLYEDGFDVTFDAVAARLASGDLSEARRLIDRAFERYPDDAMLLFLLAKLEAARGDHAAARSLFYRARDLDPVPWRVLSRHNELIRQTAEADGVHLVDLERALEDASAHRLVGFSLLADGAHPTPAGSSVIAGAILREMAQQAFAISPDAAYFSLQDPLPTFLEHAARRASPRDLELEFLVQSAVVSLYRPVRLTDVAEMYLDRALARGPTDWRVWANLASVSLLKGDVDRGRDCLRRAITLKGSADDLFVPETLQLREAMFRAGVTIESVIETPELY